MIGKMLYVLGLITLAFVSNANAELLTASAISALPYALAGLGMAGAGGYALFGDKKKSSSQNYIDSLRGQLQAIATRQENLAAQVPGLVAKQKELNAMRSAEAKKEGMQGIAENIRAERGFGNTSLQDELNRKLASTLIEKLYGADLAAEQWGVGAMGDIYGQQANTLGGMAGMNYEEEPNWAANLAGTGASMLAQNYMQDLGYKSLANAFKGKDESKDWGSDLLTLYNNQKLLNAEPEWKQYTTFKGAY